MTKLERAGFIAVGLSACLMLSSGCVHSPATNAAVSERIADREAIEDVLIRANSGSEKRDPDYFASAFADDGVFELEGPGPVFGFDKMIYRGRDDIRTIVSSMVERARNADPTKLSYDPATLRMYSRTTDSHVQFIDKNSASHTAIWMVVTKTNVNIHISNIGRYQDTLVKRDGKWLIAKRYRTQ